MQYRLTIDFQKKNTLIIDVWKSRCSPGKLDFLWKIRTKFFFLNVLLMSSLSIFRRVLSAPPPHISPVGVIAPKIDFLQFSREGCVLEKKVLAQKLFEIKFSTKCTHKSPAKAYSLSYKSKIQTFMFFKLFVCVPMSI